MKVLVLGAAGELGHPVVDALLARGVEVRALVPGPDAPVPSGVVTVEGDLRVPEAVRPHADGCTALLVLPEPDADQVELQNAAVDLAADSGTRLVKVSCWGLAVREDSASPGARRDWINQQYLRRRGLPFTVLSANHSMQALVAQHAESVRRGGVLPDPAGGRGVSLVDLCDVAQAAVRVLTEEGHDGREYLLSGPSAPTYQDIAKLLTELTGRLVECRPVDDEAEGLYRDSGSDQITDALPALLGKPATDIGDFLKANVHHFLPGGPDGAGISERNSP